MKKQVCALAMMASVTLMSGCVVDTANTTAYGPDYVDYTPGYTSYTPGYSSYMAYYAGQPNYWGYQSAYYSGVGSGGVGGYYSSWNGSTWGHRGGWGHGGRR